MGDISHLLNKIHLGDCLEFMRELPDKCVDLVVTSPPYDSLREYNNSSSWNFEVFSKIAIEVSRLLKDGGVIVWNVSDETINGSETLSSFRQAIYFHDVCGLNLHDTMIWEKPTFTSVGSLKTRYAQVFEYMFIISKGKPRTFNPIMDRINKTKGKKKHGTFRQSSGEVKPLSSIGKNIGEYGQRFNVWRMNTELSNSQRIHPAQFPIHFAYDHIISWSNEGDIVLDCFSGSGTTAIASNKSGRNFICIEKDPDYHAASVKRLEEHQKQGKLF